MSPYWIICLVEYVISAHVHTEKCQNFYSLASLARKHTTTIIQGSKMLLCPHIGYSFIDEYIVSVLFSHQKESNVLLIRFARSQ